MSKRKRKSKKEVDCAPNKKRSGVKIKKSKTNLFANKRFCVSTKANKGTDQTSEYSKVAKLIVENGGQISSTVHKRVTALISTQGALERCTQRVRKAHKLTIPIVPLSYVVDCISSNKLHSLNDYALDTSSVEIDLARRAKTREEAKKMKVNASEDAIEPKHVRKVHLGCCCSCHDENKPHCSWCEADHR